jgi:hypothetical protein
MLDVVEEHNLISTGGSDFHGFYNYYAIPPGKYITPIESLNRILRKKEAKV